jgi:hypothetical protein
MIKTYTGSFENIRLDFSLGSTPLKNDPQYELRDAHLHIYLDGEDAASGVPSGFMTYILIQLLIGLDNALAGEQITASWYSDPWRMKVQGHAQRNRIFLTLHLPRKWIALDNVSVPLDIFCKELLELSRQWLKFLQDEYAEIVADPEEGKYYYELKGYLKSAERLVGAYN